MKKIWLFYPASKFVEVSDKLYNVLAVYKVNYPPSTRLKLGQTKVIKVEDYDPWPPKDQSPALEMVYQVQRGRKPLELNQLYLKGKLN